MEDKTPKQIATSIMCSESKAGFFERIDEIAAAIQTERDKVTKLWEDIHSHKPYLHFCQEFDYLLIDINDPEFDCCNCFNPKPNTHKLEDGDGREIKDVFE